jgi:hypothetical protein
VNCKLDDGNAKNQIFTDHDLSEICQLFTAGPMNSQPQTGSTAPGLRENAARSPDEPPLFPDEASKKKGFGWALDITYVWTEKTSNINVEANLAVGRF